MSKRDYTLIVNPRSGNGKGLRVLKRVRHAFDTVGAKVNVNITQGPGDAVKLARELPLSESDGLGIIGGDGTLHEVVNGLMQRSSPFPPIGVIPAGTGNSVHQHFNIFDPGEATQRILQGKTAALDLAKITAGLETSYAANVIGWGVFVDINQTAERWRILGSARYTLAALKHIVTHKKRLAKFLIGDRVITEEILLAAVCNTQFTGKGMRLAPQADAHDGKLDVVLVKQPGRREILELFRRVFAGSHLSLPSVEYHQVESFSLHHEEDDTLTIDGELKGQTPFQVDVIPGAIQIFAK